MIYVKGTDDSLRNPKMQTLVARIKTELIRKRFDTSAELISSIYSALIEYLMEKQFIRSGPFDTSPCLKAVPDDLDQEKMKWFISTAKYIRHFPLRENGDFSELLKHLNLLDDKYLTNASVLLFGKNPQRFLLSSEVKCAHFHGTGVSKPIPSYHVYKGTVFEMVEKAIDFVLSQLALSVGTRQSGPQAPVKYEIPKEAVAEAIVNAVVHRDYTSNGSVQVMLFSDRLEVWNPGRLPPSLTLEKLREAHGSVPINPLLAEPMYLTGYIERMGTGTGDIIKRCREANLPEPDFLMTDGFKIVIYRHLKSEKAGMQSHEVTGEVTGEVKRLLKVFDGEMTRQDIMRNLGLKNEENIRLRYIRPAIESGLLEMTIPDKPRSRLQKYRLTSKGRAIKKRKNEEL